MPTLTNPSHEPPFDSEDDADRAFVGAWTFAICAVGIACLGVGAWFGA